MSVLIETCPFLTFLSPARRPARKAQVTRRVQVQIAEDLDRIMRIEQSQDGEKTHVAVHKLDENLICRQVCQEAGESRPGLVAGAALVLADLMRGWRSLLTTVVSD